MNRNITPELKRVAFIGNYMPRKCGIATFTSDLAESFSEQFPEIQTLTLAMNDNEDGYAYPDQVRYHLQQDNRFDYEHAANFLNQHVVDVISLQHEYGIYGGLAGSHILTLLRNVTAPVVTTLHTILENPLPEQYRVMKEIIKLSNRLVVMSQRSIKLLKEVYGAPAEKIDLIPHGIHDVPFVDPGFHKDKFGAEGKFVILTFGLLSANKGIEYVIEALPEVVERYPNLVYVILGSTHPHVIRHEGESYRESLQARVKELGIEENVLFLDQFVNLKDLKEYIGAADIYITPYLGREQIVSGTLAYTVGAGKAVISTPYRYAEEILADGRGLIVPFQDSKAIAEKILFLLDNEAERDIMRKRAYLYGRDMIWENVARSYLRSFDEARRQNINQLFAIPVTGFSDERLIENSQINLDQMLRMTDGTGMLQHAVYTVPNYNEGYTTDDNARALIMTVQLDELYNSNMDEGGIEEEIYQESQQLGHRYMAFLWHAFNFENKHFRNFMAYNRTWLEEIGSEDSHGRSLWALGVVLDKSSNVGLRGMAGRLFEASVGTAVNFISPRSWAFTLLGTQRYLERYPGDRAVALVQNKLAQKLMNNFKENRSEDWPWLENIVTYCNPVLPQALIRYGQSTGDEEAVEIGLDALEWLVKIQLSERGWIMPIGSRGFYQRGHEIPYFDQQPVEVHSLLSACLDAYRVTKDLAWYNHANLSFEWFFGRNAIGLPVYDSTTGGCRDGLHIDRLNENQGAESTLSFLQSLLELRQFGAETFTRRQSRDHMLPASTLVSNPSRLR